MAKKIVRKKVIQEPLFNKTEMDNSQLELYRVKQQMKQLEKREKELKGRLDEFMTHTFTPDAKGHYMFSTVDENGNKIHLQKQARKKISMNQERALKYFHENNMLGVLEDKEVVAEEVTQDQVLEVLSKHAPHLLDRKTVINETAVEQSLTDGDLFMEDFEKLCDINITYAMTYIDDKKLQKEVELNATKGVGQEI